MEKIFFWKLVIIINVFLLIIEYFGFSRYSAESYGVEWNWGWAVFFAQLLYFLLSFRIVGPTELGAKLLFGKPVQAVSSGLTFVPLGIFSLAKETRLVIQEQYPDDPEKVWKGDQSQIPPGMVPPLRVTHSQAEKPTDDPIHKRMTTEVSVVVRYKINNYILFLTTIGSIKEAKRQIRDTVVAKLREELAKRTPADTLAQWDNVNKLLKGAVDKLVESWGVDVDDVRMEEVDLGKTVNEGLRNVPRADLDKKVVITTAEGEKKKRELEGQGEAVAQKAVLSAKARGYKEIAEKLNIEDGSAVLAAETAKTTLEKSQYSIVAGSGGIADLFTTVSAIKNVLPKQKPKDKEDRK